MPCVHALYTVRNRVVYGLIGLLFNTLFGSQDSRQQQHGAPLETNPEDSSVASQGHAQARTQTAEVGPPASDAHRTAEVSSAEDAADTDGSAKNDQTAYGRPSNRLATRAGFAPGMEDKALQSHPILLVVHLHVCGKCFVSVITTDYPKTLSDDIYMKATEAGTCAGGIWVCHLQ